MTDVTRRFRANSTAEYGRALVALVEYAREHDEDWEFGPVKNVSALFNNGLTVTGPGDVVQAISDLLEREVPGLYATEALGVYNGCIRRRSGGIQAQRAGEVAGLAPRRASRR